MSDFDKLPPTNHDAEQCAIASYMLADDVLRAEMRGILKAEHFNSEDHQTIWRACVAVTDSGRPIDAVIVREMLEKRGELEQVGGTPYLATILSTIPSAAHGLHYAGIVRENAIGRCILSICDRATRRTFAPDGESFLSIAQKAESDFTKLVTRGTSSKIITLAEAGMEFFDMKAEKKPRYVCTGYTQLDECIGGYPMGRFTLIGARPAIGKSAFYKQSILNIAGPTIPCGIVTVEEDRLKIAGNALSNITGIENSHLNYRDLSSSQEQSVADALADLSDKAFIADTAFTISDIDSVIKLMAVKHQCKVIFVDHIHIIDGEMPGNRVQEVSRISATLKRLSRQTGAAIVGLCQLNRGAGNIEEYERPPVLKDLRDSGSLEQDGDVILMLHRLDWYRAQKGNPERDNQMQVFVRKNKDGPLGEIPLRWDGDTQRLTDWRDE